MNIPQLLKQALDEQRWELVAQAYTELTGLTLAIPAEDIVKEENSQQLAAVKRGRGRPRKTPPTDNSSLSNKPYILPRGGSTDLPQPKRKRGRPKKVVITGTLDEVINECAPASLVKPTPPESRGESAENRFQDDGVVFSQFAGFEKIVKATRSPRRSPVTYVDVTCSRCGKKETVSQQVMMELRKTAEPREADSAAARYRCNSCYAS